MFSFPLYNYFVPPNRYNKQELIDDILSNYEKSPSRNCWGAEDLHHSYNDWDNTEYKKPDYSSLTLVYKELVTEFTNSLGFIKPIQCQITIENYTVSTRSQNMGSHQHMPATYAAVHYLSFNKEVHQSTVFQNPSQYAPILNTMYPDRDFMNPDSIHSSPFFPDFKINAEEDMLVIFPAMINHMIAPSFSDIPRITIAFNIHISGVK